ncbi:serine/threonine-protein kinase 32B-like [Rhinoraja longicauda]
MVQHNVSKMYALKYINKHYCMEHNKVWNVVNELHVMKGLEHPFLVNLWFAFQDVEDLCLVVDLLLGGDLRYHLLQKVHFTEPTVQLYIFELALALDYLRGKQIIHRDIKPENILLDNYGHVRISDLKIAVMVKGEKETMSIAGTMPYMAPEILHASIYGCTGYDFAVDWWSLGITAYELLKGQRPYKTTRTTRMTEALDQVTCVRVVYPSAWSSATVSLLQELLTVSPAVRLSSLAKIKEKYGADINWDAVLGMKHAAGFIPKRGQLNCDAGFGLEELILEPNPLAKKKRRLLARKKTSSLVSKTILFVLDEIKSCKMGYSNASHCTGCLFQIYCCEL